jgi:protein SCO1/2
MLPRRTRRRSLVLVALGLALASWRPAHAAGSLTGATRPDLLAPFELIDTQGRPVSDRDLRGRWLLVFFGYTFCPDICPTVLREIAEALDQLGPLAGRIQPIFISIDPKRDTPARLAYYLRSLDGRILGLTGTAEQVSRAADAYGVTYYNVPGSSAGDYTTAHNVLVTVIGPEGGIVTRFSSDDSVEHIAAVLRKLVQ